MPRVPRVTGPQVETSPLPRARVSTDVPRDAFMPAQPLDFSPALRVLEQMHREKRAQADEVALLDADNRLAELEAQIRSEALARKGKDALEATSSGREGWEKGVAEIGKTLANKRQRLAYERRVSMRGESLRERIEEHANREVRTYEEETAKAGLAIRVSDAIENASTPERVASAVTEIRAIVAGHARRNGLEGDVRKALEEEWVSRAHVGVINRLLAGDNDLAAKAYYDANKEHVRGDAKVQIEKTLEEGSLRGASQRTAAEIIAKHTDETAALKAARALTDPELQDAVHQRVSNHFAERRRIQNAQQEDLYLRATNLLDARPGTPARTAVHPAIWTKLSLEQRRALERRASGDDSVNDDRAWLTFLDLPEKTIAAMSRAQFETEYWSKFDRTHRTRAESYWLAAREAAQKGTEKPELSATRTFKDIVDGALRSGSNPLIPPRRKPADFSDDEVTLYESIEREASRRIHDFELTELGGKKANAEQQQAIVDDILIRRVLVDGREIPVAVLSAEDAAEARVAYDEIPVNERLDLELRFEKAGRKATKGKLERAYAAVQRGDAALLRRIIEAP